MVSSTGNFAACTVQIKSADRRLRKWTRGDISCFKVVPKIYFVLHEGYNLLERIAYGQNQQGSAGKTPEKV